MPNILNVDSKAECPKLPVPGQNLESVNAKSPKIRIPGVIDMPIDELIRRLNEQQDVLCSLGYSYFDYIDIDTIKSPLQFFDQILRLKDELLSKLGLSKLSQTFAMEDVKAIEGVIDIAKSIQNLISAKGQPSPEQIYDLSQKLNTVLPAGYDIPNIPNIPSPIPPSRAYLDLKKRKDWSGLKYGNDDLISTYAKAYFELRGSQDEQSAQAYGDGGLYIFGRSISAVGGYVDGIAGKNGVEANAALKVFGQSVFTPLNYKDSVKVVVAASA
ncbi:MAG: hypothetical protein EOP04_15380 [Proteobacteria bacterium]|nr:MAG: hypothetical protein EOP04_15380 [Pseudomonadota bacterium]